MTQEHLAAAVGVDKTSAQGWESGRRPLALTRARDLVTLRRLLFDHGAAPDVVGSINIAMESDYILDQLTHSAVPDRHPLATYVLSRTHVDMLTWPLRRTPPAVLRERSILGRRGSAAPAPTLGQEETRRLFKGLRDVVDSSLRSTTNERIVLRRQACYLASFDHSSDTQAWLSSIATSTNWLREAGTWTPRWAEARSIATSLGRNGDPSAVERFVDAGKGNDSWELANLNYFAYWVGDIDSPQSNDTFMHDPSPRWRGLELLEHLSDRLDPGTATFPLNVRTLWALILSRRGILEDDKRVARRLSMRVATLLDELPASSSGHADLRSVYAALKLAGIEPQSD